MSESPKMTQVYLDCNATTPVLPEAAEAAQEAMRTLFGNPSSSHLVGIQAKYILESTRRLAAHAVGAKTEQIIFTSGATEAIQTAVFSVLQSLKDHKRGAKLLYGATEHKAVPEALHYWVKALGLPFEVVSIPVDSAGQIQKEFLRKELPHAALLCTMAVNNETGVVQNLSAIESLLNEVQSKVLWLVDCVQALGKIDLHLNSHRINYAPFSGHKLYAPKGIGFLYVSPGSPFSPLIVGGGQEKGFRSGTENLPGVAALGAVLEKLGQGKKDSSFHPHSQLNDFRNRLVFSLKNSFPKVVFNAPLEGSVPTTLNFSIPGFSSKELLDLFDSAGLRLSAGSACSSSSAKPSHVLDAMGLPQWQSASAIRLSFGPCTSEQEIEKGCQLIRDCAIALKETCLSETVGDFEAPENLRDGVIQFRISSNNTWLIANREARNCILIDPCEAAAERIENYVRCQNLGVIAILDTHSHADHESVRPVLQKILSDRMKSQDTDFLGWPSSSFRVILEDKSNVPALKMHSSVEGDFVLALLSTPGHTQDSRTFLYGISKSGQLKKENIRFVFCGDTILGGGLGRTNFTVSNPVDLFHSLRKTEQVINPLALLCPAHDYNNSFATSLKTECETNPLLSMAVSPMTPLSLESFVEKKQQIDQDLLRLEENFQGMVCGVTPTQQSGACAEATVSFKKLKEMISNSSQIPKIIDVREPYEFNLYKDWNLMGLSELPRNVPLSRLVNFMSELLVSRDFDQRLVFLCRSGNRSLQVAKSLRRLGFDQVWSLEGGIALSGRV
jgi:cysteine desulfurase